MDELKPLRVAIVEDEGLLRDLLRQVLGQLPGLTVVGAYGNAADAEAELPALAPDVVVLDINLGAGKSGIDLGLALRERWPRLGVVLLSNQREPALLTRIPPDQVEGWSYLHKTTVTDVETLTRALRGAAEGLVVLDAGLARQIMGCRQAVDELGERARSILTLVAQGYSNGSIAGQLHLAEKSVENQLTLIYRQLGIDSRNPALHARVQAALHYLRAT